MRAQGGRLILRIEDIDSPRVKPGAAEQAVEDLCWLGLDWDEGPDIGGPHQPYTQTERLIDYQAALLALQEAERVYPCVCSRSDVVAAASAPHAGQEGPVYPGTCAGRGSREPQQSLAAAWRFRTRARQRRYHDLMAGTQSCRVDTELGDFVVYKSNQTPAYQLAVVVDDHRMGVTEVVRGDDLIPSTFRQLEIYEFFAWPAPRFAHVPLVVGTDGRRLAKRHGDTRLATLRAAGVPPQRLIGLLAWSCGLCPTPEPVAAEELVNRFSWERLACPGPFVFRDEMLQSLLGA
jgi:glutamyl-tRNA synthetase